MADPIAVGSIFSITESGLTVFGIATGMHPEFLVAGMVGAQWMFSYQPPQPILRRFSVTAISALIAAYLTPLAVAILRIKHFLPSEITQELVQMPVAVLIGLTSHRILGPALLRRAAEPLGKGLK